MLNHLFGTVGENGIAEFYVAMRHQQHLHSGLFGGVGGLHIVYVLAEP